MAQEERRMLRRSHLLDVAVDYRTATPTAPYLAARYHVHMDRGILKFWIKNSRVPASTWSNSVWRDGIKIGQRGF